jgi:hypothetical protein
MWKAYICNSLRGKVWVNKPYVLFCSCRMAEATTSRYESNYIKIAMVVLRVSPRAVRVQFDKEFHPNCLQRTLKSEWGRLSDLQTKKRITQPQWNLLFPRTGRLLYLFCLNQFLYVMVLSTAWFLVDRSL